MDAAIEAEIAKAVKAFTQYADRVVSAVDRAVLEGVALVSSTAKVYCPVRYGLLKGSIAGRLTHDERGVAIGIIGTNVFYAPYIEFGTGKFAQNGKGRQGGWWYMDEKGDFHWTMGNKPQPFLTPALAKHTVKIQLSIAAAVKGAARV